MFQNEDKIVRQNVVRQNKDKIDCQNKDIIILLEEKCYPQNEDKIVCQNVIYQNNQNEDNHCEYYFRFYE